MPPASRRDFLHLAASVPLSGTITAAARPNVLVVLADDQGYGDFSCHGNPVLQTPNMDRLHGESVRFTDFHGSPMCTPTRGQLLTGVDALRNKACSVTAGRAVIRRDLPTMADVFRLSGYRTGLFGKWHLGDNYPYRPMDRGFEVAKYFMGWGFSSAPEFDNDYFDGRYLDNGVTKRFPGYCTDFWFDEAKKWMGERQRRNEPFFCYLPTNTPHTPNWVAQKYMDRYSRDGLPKEFFGMITNLDENLGRMEQFLSESGLKENTVVVFMTDNGGTQGVRVFNAGMRGRKMQIYEGGHRVPCFVRWPAGGLRKPGDIDTPTQVQDILPTLIDLCALKKPANARFDGTSLVSLLKDTGSIADRMMVVQYGQVPKKFDSCVIWGRWRLVNENELYDIKADPGQTKDVAAGNSSVVNRMREHYEKWWASVEPGLSKQEPISIGAPQENPTVLSSSDWWEVYVDNQRTVSNAQGGPRGAPWNIFVESDGEFEVALSRWPPHLKLPLTAGREAQVMTAGKLEPGKAVPIAGAKLEVDGQSKTANSKPGDIAIYFRVRLKKGTTTRLHGWFLGDGGADLCGAFYAVVRKLDG